MANGNNYSAAGQLLGFGVTASNYSGESDEDRKKRLQALAQAQSKLGNAQNYSPAGQALFGGYGAAL